MQHYSSSFFISKDNPANPIFHSMNTPTLTIRVEYQTSHIALHFDSFEEIREFSRKLTSLLNLQEERFPNG